MCDYGKPTTTYISYCMPSEVNKLVILDFKKHKIVQIGTREVDCVNQMMLQYN
jgi:hypothetical protein